MFGAELTLALDSLVRCVQNKETFSPAEVDSFFVDSLLLSTQTKSRPAAGVPSVTLPASLASMQARIAAIVDAAFETFLHSLHGSQNSGAKWFAHDLSRAVVLKTRLAAPPVVRAALSVVLTAPFGTSENQIIDPNKPNLRDSCRLISFVLGMLDFASPGPVEREVADDFITGDYCALSFAFERIGFPSEVDEDGFVARVFTAVGKKWPIFFQFRNSTTTILLALKSCEALLRKSFERKVALDEITLRSISNACVAAHTIARTTDRQDVEVETEYRVFQLLAFGSKPDLLKDILGDTLSLPRTGNGHNRDAVYYHAEDVRVVAFALGAHSDEAVIGPKARLALRSFIAINAERTCWIVAEAVLETANWTRILNRWAYDCNLAAERVGRVKEDIEREVRENATLATTGVSQIDWCEWLEMFLKSLFALESSGSIRHLQRSAAFFVKFGTAKAYGVAASRFLNDAAKRLHEVGRFWESANAHVMLGTCRLLREEESAASKHFQSAYADFEACDAFVEAENVRMASRSFALSSKQAKSWEWVFVATDVRTRQPNAPSAAGHYFLVGAVGTRDADLTVVRCIAISSHAAFDSAVQMLETDSKRKRVRGELRWSQSQKVQGETEHQFFPLQAIAPGEQGFWIHRVWPCVGEDSQERCPARFGIVGERRLVLVSEPGRGLNPLISAASMYAAMPDVSASSSQIDLDVPLGWVDDDVPMPPPYPPPPIGDGGFGANAMPAEFSASFDDEQRRGGGGAGLAGGGFDEQRRGGAVFAGSDLDEQRQGGGGGFAVGGASSELNSEAPTRQKGASRSVGDASSLAGENSSSNLNGGNRPPFVGEGFNSASGNANEVDDAKKRKAEFLLKKREREAAAAAAASAPSIVIGDATSSNALSSTYRVEGDADDDVSQGAVDAKRSNHATDTLLLKRKQQNGNDANNEQAAYLAQNRRRVVLVPATDMDDILAQNSNRPKKKITLLDHPLASSQGRKITLEPESPRVAAGPSFNDSLDSALDNSTRDSALTLPPHSSSRAFFNVGGARVTVEEASLVNKFLTDGVAWVGAELLYPAIMPVSLKFTAQHELFQVFSEPSFELLHAYRLDASSSIEKRPGTADWMDLLFSERRAQGLGSLLIKCDRVELLCATFGAFKSLVVPMNDLNMSSLHNTTDDSHRLL